MKRIIFTTIILAIFTLSFFAHAEIYPTTFIVTNINVDNNLLTLTDFTGNEWLYESIEDWFIGDITSAIMDNNNSEHIEDDIIIQLKYEGYIEDWEYSQLFIIQEFM